MTGPASPAGSSSRNFDAGRTNADPRGDREPDRGAMTSAHDDPFDLRRFLEAQADVYPRALAELRAGRKQTHWMWFVLPQLRGLGSSPTAALYGITSEQEARAYLAHPVLGARLRECVAAMNALDGPDAAQVLGQVDAAKFRSCLTLFSAVDPGDTVFGEALRKYFAGVPDEKSLALLEASRRKT